MPFVLLLPANVLSLTTTFHRKLIRQCPAVLKISGQNHCMIQMDYMQSNGVRSD